MSISLVFKPHHLWDFGTAASEWDLNSSVKEENEAGRGDGGLTGSDRQDHGFE